MSINDCLVDVEQPQGPKLNGKISKHLSGLLQHSVCIQRVLFLLPKRVCRRACHAQDCHVAISSVGQDIRPLVSSLVCQRLLALNLHRLIAVIRSFNSAQHASCAFSNDTLCAAGRTAPSCGAVKLLGGFAGGVQRRSPKASLPHSCVGAWKLFACEVVRLLWRSGPTLVGSTAMQPRGAPAESLQERTA